MPVCLKEIIVSPAPRGEGHEQNAEFWNNVMKHCVTNVVCLCSEMGILTNAYNQYWADEFSEDKKLDFGNISVTTIDSESMCVSLVKSKLLIERRKSRGGEVVKKIVVTHWHYTGWPDDGVPEDHGLEGFKILTKFITEFLLQKANKNKVLVHCREGRGKSGTMLAIISQMIMYKRTEKLPDSIAHTVSWLRKYRKGLVTNLAEYEFIHRYVDQLSSINQDDNSEKLKMPHFDSHDDMGHDEHETKA